MKRTLSEILRAVALAKGLKSPDKWVEQRLEKAQVKSDYHSYILLHSHRRMWFGLRDGEFECQPFVLFRQYKNNDDNPEINEFEIYTFSHLTDDLFRKLVKEAYHEKFDTIEDCRLFYNLHPVNMVVQTVDGKPAVLGEFNEINEVPDLYTDLFQLTINFPTPQVKVYAADRDVIKLAILKYKDLNMGVIEKLSDDRQSVYDVSNFFLTHNGKLIRVELYSVNGEYFVDLIEKRV